MPCQTDLSVGAYEYFAANAPPDRSVRGGIWEYFACYCPRRQICPRGHMDILSATAPPDRSETKSYGYFACQCPARQICPWGHMSILPLMPRQTDLSVGAYGNILPATAPADRSVRGGIWIFCPLLLRQTDLRQNHMDILPANAPPDRSVHGGI